MLVTFLDERILPLPTGKRVTVANAIFRRDQWLRVHHLEASVGGVGGKRRLDEIQRLLEAGAGFGVVTYADIRAELLPPGEVDATPDIPAMSRTDNAWTTSVLANVAVSVALVQAGSRGLADVELFFDPKDLTAAHRAAFEQVLRQILPELAVEAVQEFGHELGIKNGDLRFTRIEAVPKPDHGAMPSPLQRGTNLAHHLCAQAARDLAPGVKGMNGRIAIRDNTATVCEYLEIFKG